jgi:uncharacterized protein YndB with AHSA1/START domain
MLKKIGLGLLVVVALLLVVIATRPSTFHVERSTQVAAPATLVYAQFASVKAFTAWMPWSDLDPTMKMEFSGPDTGVGASYSWVGNKQVGRGEMTVTETVPDSKVTYRLEFKEPMEATNTTTLALAPAGDGVRVTWSMEGNNNFVAKAFSLVMDMDKMIGPDFEKGLARLKARSEAEWRQIATASVKAP